MPEATSVQRVITPEMLRLTPALATAKSDSEVENFALRYTFAPVWIYQVPVGQEFLIKPEHRFSAYIEDDEAGAAEWSAEQKVRVEVWDPNLKRMQIVYQGLYVESKEMQDKDKMATLDLLDAPLYLPSGSWIYICGNAWSAIYTIDVSDSFFSLELLRVRPSLYK